MEVVRTIPFSAIPGWPKAALLFVHSAEFRTERFPAAQWLETEPSRILTRAVDRRLWQKAAELIVKTMAPLTLTEQQQNRLQLLHKDSVRLVVTAQQPGILTGPLYTALKVWTAITVAETLQSRFPDYCFVPLLWIDDNDSDWEEVSTVWSYDEDFQVRRITMEWEPHKSRAPVEAGVFGAQAKNVLRQFYHGLPNSEERKEALHVLEPLYRYRTLFLDAFLQEMQWLFGEQGLLMIRASLLRRAGLMQKILEDELWQPGRTQQIIEQSYAQWGKRWSLPMQAKPKTINAFVVLDGERQALQYDGEQWQVGNSCWTFQELRAWLESHPGQLTTTVLTRPLVQDMVLPTVVSVLGPSELAYWAELREVFEARGVPMSAVQLRYSLTLLEPKARRKIRKLPIRYEDFFQRYEDLEAVLLRATDWQQYEERFQQIYQTIEETLHHLLPVVDDIDPGLKATTERTKQQVLKLLDRLHQKMRRSYKFRLEVQLDHLRKLHHYLYPQMALQERRITPWYFVARFGKERFVHALRLVALNDPQQGHFVVEI